MKNLQVLTNAIPTAADPSSEIVSWISKIQDNAFKIGMAIILLAVIICGIIIATGGERGLDKGKKIAISIIAGLAVILFGGTFVLSLAGVSI